MHVKTPVFVTHNVLEVGQRETSAIRRDLTRDVRGSHADDDRKPILEYELTLFSPRANTRALKINLRILKTFYTLTGKINPFCHFIENNIKIDPISSPPPLEKNILSDKIDQIY